MPTSTPCPSCQQPRQTSHYLCRACWFELPHPTRAALGRRDRLAVDRLSELYDQIHDDVPLSEIRVAP